MVPSRARVGAGRMIAPAHGPVGRDGLGIQERLNPAGQRLPLPDLTLPDHQGSPAHLRQASRMPRIALTVAPQFGAPVLLPGAGDAPSPRTIMHMPEATMHEDDAATGGKDQIGFTGEPPIMQPVPIAHAVGEPPDDHFRSRVPAPDRAHVLAPIHTEEG